MDRSIVSRVEEWESRPAPGGYVGLNQLADEEFTGAVTAGGTHLFMLNGRVVGVFGGDIAAFEGAESVAYESPDPALPLLFSMQEQEGEVRGQYYTDDTPIREVDETLTSSGFSGYLELSENVLSGDYYVVYYGGRSLSAAFVGNEGRTVTGDEAFELAADEVGIYEVTSVDLEVTDVPEPPEDAAPAAGGAAAGEDAEAPATVAEGADEDDSVVPEDAADAPVDDPDDAAESEATAERDADDAEPPADATEAASDGTRVADAEAGDAVEDAPDDTAPEEVAGADDAGAIEEAEPAEAPATSDAAGETRDQRVSTDAPSGEAPAEPARPQEGSGRAEADERFEEEARWREAATVPALDPDESAPTEEEPTPETGGGRTGPRTAQQTEPPATDDVDTLRERLGRLETRLEETEQERRRLEEELSEARTARGDLADERDALAERIEELEARLESAEARGAAGESDDPAGRPPSPTGGSRAVDPETALDQTDLFVRYSSKANPTLETAHDGRAGAEEVAGNLRIETHSRFDTDTATVDGRPFTGYLEDTIQYRFVSWLVEELLYEIQETGTESGLRDVFDVLPELDRAEFNGAVTSYDEEGEEVAEAFDVVCRDRMGKPLIVANINDSLDPATGDMMAGLVEDATAAAEAHESLGAAFLVTASFFEPDALETAAEATRGGGFLSRDSKKSFVKLARNGGYHLCLAEARGDDFHVAVPEF